MKTIKEMIKIMKAAKEGKEIEVLMNQNNWKTITNPIWNWEKYNYRVKDKTKDWRLPTAKELLTIIDYNEKVVGRCRAGLLEDQEVCSEILSSTVFAKDNSCIWSVYFSHIGATLELRDKRLEFNVRYVREKSDGSLEWSRIMSEEMNYEDALKHAKTLTDKDICL